MCDQQRVVPPFLPAWPSHVPAPTPPPSHTHQATPMVSGAAALLWSVAPPGTTYKDIM